jgi:hypothetical protein
MDGPPVNPWNNFARATRRQNAGSLVAGSSLNLCELTFLTILYYILNLSINPPFLITMNYLAAIHQAEGLLDYGLKKSNPH